MKIPKNNKAGKDEAGYIFRPYITKKDGTRIYPKNGKVFKIPIKKAA